jgi:tRNA/tmRNA/rRNA uracil-C5-methylase (TrmA/RlmC/RlmD family)
MVDDLSSEPTETLDLAFFRRGSKGKIPVDGTSLARPEINQLARAVRDLLRTKPHITARNLKTLMIRCDQTGNTVWQLYIKDKIADIITEAEAAALPAIGGEVIYSDPRSPASRITTRLARFGDPVLTDTILGVEFSYATEGFFQVNVPVYEKALRGIQQWVNATNPDKPQPTRDAVSSAREGSAFPAVARQDPDNQLASSGPERVDGAASRGNTEHNATPPDKLSYPVLDLYSGVGSIGLTIGGPGVTLVESNEHAVREMRANITRLGVDAQAVLAPTEKALEHITSDQIVIVDPPRAGLHTDVVDRLLETKPPRIIYLSCNPVTQARDVALLCADKTYGIRAHRGYNFFPRTPHIEHLIVLEPTLAS